MPSNRDHARMGRLVGQSCPKKWKIHHPNLYKVVATLLDETSRNSLLALMTVHMDEASAANHLDDATSRLYRFIIEEAPKGPALKRKLTAIFAQYELPWITAMHDVVREIQ